MTKKLKQSQEIAQKLNVLNQPVITVYDLNVLIFKLFNGRTKRKDIKDFINSKIRELEDQSIIIKLKYFPHKSVYCIFGKDTSNKYEIICCVDPFCYISHLCAMDYHGITDRNPESIIITTYDHNMWRSEANKKMKKDLKDLYTPYIDNNLKKLEKIKITKINKKQVNQVRSASYGNYKNIKESNLRIATIGRTFLDMIKKPEMCGGIYHVIEVYKEYAEIYKKLIINEINKSNKDIDKIRAGYILEKECDIKDSSIDEWKNLAQRGGSRKLNHSEEYSSNYSEEWCLSINI
ncbi:MAG: type IV toxin-antitoxin system AbiEi family antitoxin domain-containing protein [archaeon]